MCKDNIQTEGWISALDTRVADTRILNFDMILVKMKPHGYMNGGHCNITANPAHSVLRDFCI